MAKTWAGTRLYYGWLLVFTLSITETTSWGILFYAFTVFLKPMQDELGWSRGELTGAFSLALLVSALAGLVVGRWLDRHGPRLLMTVGVVPGFSVGFSLVRCSRPDNLLPDLDWNRLHPGRGVI